jgi:phosphotriesterase-related protein
MTEDRTTSGVGVDSGNVMTVLGPVPVEEMGITLVHEHTLIDSGVNGPEPKEVSRAYLFNRPLTIDILGEVRALPQSNRDNQRLNDIKLVSGELNDYAIWGGRTIVEQTVEGIGRDPRGVQQISRASGVNIILGAGFYIELSQPSRLATMSVDDIADEVVRDVTEGIPGTGVRAGIIGEIGIDRDVSPAEIKNLRGAARASRRTGVPISVHTIGVSAPGTRLRVLDIIEEEGAPIQHTMIDHVTLRPTDFETQLEIARRGAFLGYDTVSSDFNWGHRGSGLCDHEIIEDIKRLIEAGYVKQILLSMDLHMKIMLKAYGGAGYGYLLREFVPMLRQEGVGEEHITTMLVDNPQRYFSSRYAAARA